MSSSVFTTFPGKLAAIVCLAASASAGPAAIDSELADSIAAKLRQPVHTHFGAFNWDIFDFPQKPGGDLKLESVREKGKVIDVAQLKGRPVVLVEIDPSDRYTKRFWLPAKGAKAATAVAALRRLRREFQDKGVEFIAVWGTGRRKVPRNRQIADALAYAGKVELPCPMTVALPPPPPPKDAPKWERRQKPAFSQFVQVHLPGHPQHSITCVLDQNGDIVYRASAKYDGFSYHTVRHVLDRLLHPKYEKAVRHEFAGAKSRLLPKQERADGRTTLKDDFDSYKDQHQFKLEPRWGFNYDRQSRLDVRAGLAPGRGRGGSAAAHLDTYCDSLGQHVYGLQHELPEPLNDGHLKFYLRRQPGKFRDYRPTGDNPSEVINRALCVSFGQPNSNRAAGHLMATGGWGKETFVLDYRSDRPGKVRLSPDQWHEVAVTCRPGQKASISVDGHNLGQLNSDTIDWLGFRTANRGKGFFVDDVEIHYNGKENIAEPDLSAIPPAPEFTAEERSFIHQELVPTVKGEAAANLPEGTTPRQDIVGYKPPWLTFDHPLPAAPLLMEDLRHPSQLVNVIHKYKGKIIWVTRLLKGDHAAEPTMRKRTALRSPTVFNRVYRLAREYRPKGVVVIGVMCYDGGHRDTSVSYEDRKRTAFEIQEVSEDLTREMNLPPDQIIYGAFDDAYDEVVMEQFVNQNRLWSKSLRGKLERGAFAGMGPDSIIDQNGDVVYRGTGPDGFQYWKAKYVLDRLLDPAFDQAVRRDLRDPKLKHHRSPLLPARTEKPDGLLYQDGFESYADTYDYALSPCWGFDYQTYPNEDRGAIFKDQGVDGSTALLVNGYYPADMFCGNKAIMLCGRHVFPRPLTDGYFRLLVERGPRIKFPYFGRPPLYRIGLVITGDGGKSKETLTTIGDWKHETFHLVETKTFLKWNCYRAKIIDGAIVSDTKVPMREDGWQEIKIVCAPGRKAELLIDGQEAATLDTNSISGVELRGESWSGVYVDEVELFYRGAAAEIKDEHDRALADSFAKKQQEWLREAND